MIRLGRLHLWWHVPARGPLSPHGEPAPHRTRLVANRRGPAPWAELRLRGRGILGAQWMPRRHPRPLSPAQREARLHALARRGQAGERGPAA